MVQFSLDVTFGALADETRRGVLSRLGRREETITQLADAFSMTLTGMKKHVRVLEGAGLVATRKIGRVRYCGLTKRKLDRERAFFEAYAKAVEERFERLDALLEEMKEQE